MLTDSGHLLYQYDFGHSLADMQVSGPGLYLAIVQHGFSSPEFVNADISIDFLKVSPGCPADLAQPFGVLDLADINAFTGGFTMGSPIGDLDGNGILDLADIGLFIASFTAGCP